MVADHDACWYWCSYQYGYFFGCIRQYKSKVGTGSCRSVPLLPSPISHLSLLMDQTPALDSTYDRQAVIWCCLRLNYPPSHSFGAALIGVIIASVLVEPLPSSCYVLIQTTSYRLYGGKQLSALSPLFPSHSCRPVSCSQVLYYFNNNKNRDPFHNSLVCLCALPSVSQILTPDRLLQHGCLIRSTRRSSLTQVRFLSMSPISEITSI